MLYYNTAIVAATRRASSRRCGALGAQQAQAWALRRAWARGRALQADRRAGAGHSGLAGRSGRASGHRRASARERAGSGTARRSSAQAAGRQARTRQGAAGVGARGAGRGRAAWAPGLAGAVHLVHSAVFGPVRLSIFLSQNFWTLFVNPVHEHCSSRNFSKKKNILNLIKNQIKSNKF